MKEWNQSFMYGRYIEGDKMTGTKILMFGILSLGLISGPVARAQVFTTQVPRSLKDSDGARVNYELGMKFTAKVAGKISAIRFYKSPAEKGAHTGHIFSASGAQLAAVVFSRESASGWQQQALSAPLAIAAGTQYVVSVNTGNSYYVDTVNGLASAVVNGTLSSVAGNNGVFGPVGKLPTQSWNNSNYFRDIVFTSGSSAPPPTPNPTPNPTPSPSPSTLYPSASNTGVPAGTVLTPSGDITVTVAGTVIDSKQVTGCIFVQANNVTIKNSKILGGNCYEPIHITEPYDGLVVQDTEIDGQKSAMCGEAIGTEGYTIIRVNAHGCSDGPRLAGSANITLQDSYIHDLSNLPGDHGDGTQAYGLSLAAGNSVQILHNTIEGGDNSAIFTADDATGDLIVDGNLLMGSNYPLKLYDNHAWVRNNLIYDDSGNEYSGFYGPVATFFGNSTDPGLTIEEWTNNHLTSKRDGSVIGALIPQP
jgi:hypothetical protein